MSEHDPHEPISDCDCQQCAIAERDRLKQERDELAAQVEVLRKFARHRNDAEVCCDLLRHSEFSCTCGYDKALSITPSDALREVKAGTLDDTADILEDTAPLWANWLRNVAAAIRKGE